AASVQTRLVSAAAKVPAHARRPGQHPQPAVIETVFSTGARGPPETDPFGPAASHPRQSGRMPESSADAAADHPVSSLAAADSAPLPPGHHYDSRRTFSAEAGGSYRSTLSQRVL